MKKVISAMVCFGLLLSRLNCVSFAVAGASFESDDFTFSAAGNYSYSDIESVLDGYENTYYQATKQEIKDKFSSQLRAVNIYADGIDRLEDIFGIQLTLSLEGKGVAIAYADTDLQNGDKIGTSLWEVFLSHQNNYDKATLLLYGTKSATSEVNIKANKTKDGRYKIATLYIVIGNDADSNFKLNYETVDVAAKNSKGEVISLTDEFKSETSCNGEYSEEDKTIHLSMLGAQIRVTGNQGIRFGAKLINQGYIEKCTDLSFGILIAVTNHLGNNTLEIDCKTDYIDCQNRIYSENDDETVFVGSVEDFPKDGSYDDVNFTARAYVKFKDSNSGEYETVYSEPIVRNVEQIKSKLGE